MNQLLQGIVVDLVVLAAALWLAWSFAPRRLRARLRRSHRAKPAYDVALQADELDGARPRETTCDCGGGKACH